MAVFFSAKEEQVTKKNETKTKTFFWLEFVDRDVQPNYVAQRGIDVQKFPSEGISVEELVEMAISGTVMAVQLGIDIGLMVASSGK